MSPTETSTFFDFAPEPLAVLGSDGTLLAANDAFRHMLGIPGADLVSNGIVGLVHPEDIACWLGGLRAMATAVGPNSICVRCRAANGDWRWLEWTCSLSPNAQIFAAARDVTHHRLDARRLHQLEAQMDAVTAEVWLLDREGRVVQANDYLSTLLGIPESDMLGKRREDIKPGLDSPDECFAETMRIIQTGLPIWQSVERWGGPENVRWSSVDKVPLRGEDNAITHVVVFAYEITSQIAAELDFRRLNEQLELRVALRTDELAAANTALRISEERTSSILANALDAVVTMSRDGIITGWNAAAERILGWTAAEALNHEVAKLIIPRENRAAHRMGLVRARETGTGPAIGKLIEVKALRKDGESFSAELSITGAGSGPSLTFTAFIRDISERKTSQNKILDLNHQLELHIEEANAANRELEAFSYSVSHDLRTPLRSIDGFSLALIEDYGHLLDAGGKDYMARVRSATQRMGRLIDDLLNLSRVSRIELKLDLVDLTAIANDIAEELRRSAPERAVTFNIQPELTASADAALIRIVLENLLGNAWKYTAHCESACIEFSVEELNQRRIFRVRDNGAGFDMTYADKLFAPFQRLHRADEFEGSGVGLATVQRVLHRHGGHAWAEGAVDKGATVYFTL